MRVVRRIATSGKDQKGYQEEEYRKEPPPEERGSSYRNPKGPGFDKD